MSNQREPIGHWLTRTNAVTVMHYCFCSSKTKPCQFSYVALYAPLGPSYLVTAGTATVE